MRTTCTSTRGAQQVKQLALDVGARAAFTAKILRTGSGKARHRKGLNRDLNVEEFRARTKQTARDSAMVNAQYLCFSGV